MESLDTCTLSAGMKKDIPIAERYSCHNASHLTYSVLPVHVKVCGDARIAYP
jgi:hypothetical protein